MARIWNRFGAEINCSGVAAITKFSHLKKHVDPKVKTTNDGLPFTRDGYQWAKTS